MRLLQVSNFWKEKTLWKVNLSYQWIIQCNTDSCYEHMAGGVSIYLYGFVSLLVPECAGYLCVYVCVISNQNTTKKSMCQTWNVWNIASSFWYSGTKARHLWIYNIIKWNNTSNVSQSPIQSKKQDIKNSSESEGWRQREIGVGQNFNKVGVGNLGGSS